MSSTDIPIGTQVRIREGVDAFPREKGTVVVRPQSWRNSHYEVAVDIHGERYNSPYGYLNNEVEVIEEPRAQDASPAVDTQKDAQIEKLTAEVAQLTEQLKYYTALYRVQEGASGAVKITHFQHPRDAEDYFYNRTGPRFIDHRDAPGGQWRTVKSSWT